MVHVTNKAGVLTCALCSVASIPEVTEAPVTTGTVLTHGIVMTAMAVSGTLIDICKNIAVTELMRRCETQEFSLLHVQ